MTLPTVRWNPQMENVVFLNQSALLYGSYYSLQIVIHRPFIPSPRKPSGITFPSLEICTNAARSCIHVLDVHSKRVGRASHLSQVDLIMFIIQRAKRVLIGLCTVGKPVQCRHCVIGEYLGCKTVWDDCRPDQGDERGSQSDGYVKVA